MLAAIQGRSERKARARVRCEVAMTREQAVEMVQDMTTLFVMCETGSDCRNALSVETFSRLRAEAITALQSAGVLRLEE
jgi:hypothetical protein